MGGPRLERLKSVRPLVASEGSRTSKDSLNTIVGVALIVLGILLIVGVFSISPLLGYLGVALVVLGVLILLHTLPGGTMVGVVVLVIGVLMLRNFIELPSGFTKATGDLFEILDIVAGAVLLALGIAKLTGK